VYSKLYALVPCADSAPAREPPRAQR
jgi:hypothetical protein